MIDYVSQFLLGGGVLVAIIVNIGVILSYRQIAARTREEENALRIARRTCFILVIVSAVSVVIYVFANGGTVDGTDVPIVLPESKSSDTEIPTSESYVKNKALPDGKYTGDFNFDTNNPDGFGTMRYSSGDIYEGDWKDGLREGTGTMKYKNGDVYRGEWQGNLKNGEGVYKWSDGSVYEGHYANDMRNGKGTYKNWTGIIYNNEQWTGEYYGEHVNDSFDGQGTFTMSNGDMFDGIFKKGQVWYGVYTRNGVEFQIKDGKQVG